MRLSLNNSLGMVFRLRAGKTWSGDAISVRTKRFISSSKLLGGLLVHRASCFDWYWARFHRSKGAVAWSYLLAYFSKFKNEWRYTSMCLRVIRRDR